MFNWTSFASCQNPWRNGLIFSFSIPLFIIRLSKKLVSFSFFSLSGNKINFDNLLIKDNGELKFYFSLFIFFILSLVLVIFFVQKRRLKADEDEEKKDTVEQKYLFIRADRADHRVLLNEITLIEGKKDYVKVTVQDKSYFVRKNLKQKATSNI